MHFIVALRCLPVANTVGNYLYSTGNNGILLPFALPNTDREQVCDHRIPMTSFKNPKTPPAFTQLFQNYSHHD